MKEFKFISKKKKDKINIFSPGDDVNSFAVNGSFRTEIFSNKSLTLEGCLGVLDYTDYYIKIRVKKGYTAISGASLNISYYDNKTITVMGKITNVEFLI